jgi:hypothetical protein
VIHCLRGRVLKPEILDTLPFDQAKASLGDLIRLNSRWGGHNTLRRLLSEVDPGPQFSLLDVGAASGDMAARIRAWYPAAAVTSLDRLVSHLAQASGPRVVGDAFDLPFGPKSVDYVFCSLFLHHFTDEEVVRLLSGFGEVARRAVLVIDLYRNPIPYYFIPWTQWLFRWSPVTVNDGPISVEAAFHPQELEAFARHAGLKNPRARSYWPAFRIAMVADVSK